MNSRLVVLLAVVGLIVLVIVGSPKAQPRLAPREPEPEEMRLRIGQEAVVHASIDSAIEILIDQPFTIEEQLKLRDLATGKEYALPNGAWVRAQGYLSVGRSPDAENKAEVLVRWRAVDTMFSFSRRVFSN